MRKVFEVLKKYLVINFVLSIAIFTWVIVSMVRSNTLPTIDLLYIIRIVFGILLVTVMLLPATAIIDLIIKTHMSLVKDFKESDRKGRIIIIVSIIIVLLRKIVIWTR